MLLVELHKGEKAFISSISDGYYKEKLYSLGICQGSEISLVRYSPLKDLVLIKIYEQFIALNTTESMAINVEK